jgi:Flp pilus assembly protein TadG
MKTLVHRPSRHPCRQSGVAAIELAIILPVLIVFLTFPFFYARCFWHYTAAQKAAQDAAHYLATVPLAEMRSKKTARAAAAIALEIAQREIAELAPGTAFDPPQVTCDGLVCGSTIGKAPTKVRVFITFGLVDNLGVVDTPWYGLVVTADVTLRYVGA